jgi:hypothetical protein
MLATDALAACLSELVVRELAMLARALDPSRDQLLQGARRIRS